MSGRPKQGIDYAGWSVNIFDGDTKIDKLLDAQGWVGFSIYFYLCQMAYKFDGYFYRWTYDDAATTARRMGGGVGSETVRNTVGLCLQIGLFDKPLFDRDGILTSKGIQRRFYAAIQGRRAKSVIGKYWLLKDDECKGLEKCAENDDAQPANEHLQGSNGDLQCANDTKVKESKGKESKENKINCVVRPQNRNGVPPTLDEVLEFAGMNNCDEESAQDFFRYFSAGGWMDRYGTSILLNWQQKLIAWDINSKNRKAKEEIDRERSEKRGDNSGHSERDAKGKWNLPGITVL